MNTESNFPVIGFIGAGNMASAIIGGLLAKNYPPKNIWASDPSSEKLAQMASDWGISISEDNQQVASEAEVLVLAVKPQVLGTVAQALKPTLEQKPALVISIAAGIMVDSMQRWLGDETAIVRCMPNTPALVETGASGLFANSQVSDAQKQQAEQILSAVGISLWVDQEEQLDAVTAVSGSGPAYYFLVMEAMISAGERLGLSTDVSTQLTLQTALGAAKMAKASDVDVAELRRRVTSPNGTTEKAVEAFEQGDIRGLFDQAMVACADRSKSLAEELGSD
ncbi:MAG: pyrroline-5-carboxylate reductase [Motiliproteus sp.]|nr:pyrroline-5-carboxylate reductase [Motiliproteus sp.]MCW9050832.1 pyrroline-5-carboxylate reductase [Motiliproteus sp.]